MRFSQLAAAFQKLEETASRNAITNILAGVFRRASPDEIDKICYLALGELVPSYRGLEFNIAEKMMIQILAAAYERPRRAVTARYKDKGDLGDVAAVFAKERGERVAPAELSVREVYDELVAIAAERGTGSQERKIARMAGLLGRLDPLSVKFVTRIPVGKLRLGFSDATILDALSYMIKGDKSARPLIERAYNVTADIGEIASRLKRRGLEALERIEPKPGVPIRPSLAERIPDPKEIMRKLGPRVAIEPKLDGFRTAIHVLDGKAKTVMLFSRNLENTTHMFPEIVSAAKSLNVSSAILDGEAIGYDPKKGTFTAFQETVQRKRKYGIEEMAKKIPLVIFVFDILYLDGTSLLEEPFHRRRAILEKILRNASSGAIRLVQERLTDDPAVIEEELKNAVKAELEGIVVKNLNSRYEAGSRGFHWVKFKPTSAALGKIRAGLPAHAYRQAGGKSGLPDTIDCVVMGAYRGKGRRAEFGVGGFLLGVRGTDGRFYTISRLGSGLSDENFREMFRWIKKQRVKDAPREYVVAKETVPDIWVRPSLVVEILTDEITLSPRHTAGSETEGRGYSFRFPRLVRLRKDKNPEDATAISEIERMYRIARKGR